MTERNPRPLPSKSIREIDRRAIEELGVPGVVLMENAGRGAAELARMMLSLMGGPVVILAGRGNNGGDGYVVARHLANAGIDVRVFLLSPSEEIAGDARVNLDIIMRMGLAVKAVKLPDDEGLLCEALAGAALVVDALLGTGIRGQVRAPFDGAIKLINDARRPVLAIDIPSGLEADTGELLGIAVKATATATFFCPKLGFERGRGPEHTGSVTVVDIGIPYDLAFRQLESPH